MNIDWYPTKAKQQHDTGRVLVGFTIDSKGKAVSMKILKAEAPRILRNAALNFVTDVTFDVSDPAYNPSDPTPFAISVRFCIIECGSLVGSPGYEDAGITGSPVTPLGSLLGNRWCSAFLAAALDKRGKCFQHRRIDRRRLESG